MRITKIWFDDNYIDGEKFLEFSREILFGFLASKNENVAHLIGYST